MSGPLLPAADPPPPRAPYDQVVNSPAMRITRLPQVLAAWVAALPRRRQERVQDLALALVLAVVNALSLLPFHAHLHPLWLAEILVVLQAIPLIWRRSGPGPGGGAVLGSLVIGAARVAYDQIGFGSAPFPLGPAIALYTVMMLASAWWRWIVGAFVVAGVSVSLSAPGHNEPYEAITQAFIFLTAAAAGVLSRARQANLRAAESRADRAEAEMDRHSARAAARERVTIARELHDVVAHHVSLMAVQAEAAASLLPGQPAQAARSVAIIGDTARLALTELRRLLGVLRGPGDRLETAPSASLGELDGVLEQVRGAGLPVDFEVVGTPGQLAPGVDLTAYRIVQEALTNTIRHAHADRAAVTVTYEPGYITVRVADSGPRLAPDPNGRPAPAAEARLARGLDGTGLEGRPGGGRARAGRHRRAGRLVRREPLRGPDAVRRFRRHRPAARPMSGPAGPAGKAPIRVLVVDDQELVRSGFCVILDAADGITVVGEAANGEAAVSGAAAYQPNVVLMDIRMPGMDGLEATRLITGTAPAPKVVMLTTFDLDDYVYEALRAGASGFLLKDSPRHDLIAAIRAAAAGDALLAPSVTRRLIEAFARRPPETTPSPSRLASLTARERDVLLLLARGRSNAEIAAALFVSEATVKTHVGNVLAKLGLRDRVQAVILAYETGLVVPGEPAGE